MNPLLIAVPVIGGVALYLLWPKSKAPVGPSPYTPAPGAPAITSGGPRALTYQQQINAALLAFRAAKLIGGSAVGDAGKQLVGTLDVVNGMVTADLTAGRVTAADKAAIDVSIAAAKKEVG